MITDLQNWVHGDHNLSLIEDAMDHHSYIHSFGSGCEKAVCIKKSGLYGGQTCELCLKITVEILLAVCSISTSVQMIKSLGSDVEPLPLSPSPSVST